MGAAPAGGPRCLGASGIQSGAGGRDDEPGAAQEASAALHRPGGLSESCWGRGGGPPGFPRGKTALGVESAEREAGAGREAVLASATRRERNFVIMPRCPWKGKRRRSEKGAAGRERCLCGVHRDPGPPAGCSWFLPRVEKEEEGSRRGAAVKRRQDPALSVCASWAVLT